MRYIGDLNLLTSQGLPRANDDVLKTILVDVFVILGAISVLMILIAGLRYILARGNPDSIAQARNMLVYSLMGLVIAALASTIVNFVLGRAG